MEFLSAELLQMIVANAPAVVVLMWLSYALRTDLQKCVQKQSEIMDRLLDHLGVSDETPNSR